MMNSISGSFMVNSCGSVCSSTHRTCFLSCLVACTWVIYCIKIQIFLQMPPKKKVMCLEGQTQLSFASQCLEQEGQELATSIEKDDAVTTQAKSKERKFFKLRLKKYSWLVYEKNGNYSCTCTAESVQRLGNLILTEWASTPSAEI